MDNLGSDIDLRQKNEIMQTSGNIYEEEPEEIGVCANINEALPREFTTVSIVNSSSVQIGNNIYYHGPVTVNQIEPPLKNDIIERTKPPDTTPTSKKDFYTRIHLNQKKWRFVIGGIIAVGLSTVIYLFISLTRSSSYSDLNNYPVPTRDYSVPHNDSSDLNSNRTRIYEHSAWTHRTESQKIDPLKTPVPIVMIIHSATSPCTTFDQCTEEIRGFQSYHMDVLDWEDIGFNFLIGGDGRIYEGRGWDKMGAHTFGWNRNSTGICLIGNFQKEEPTAEQISATHKLIELGVYLGKISPQYRLIAQKQVQATESPGRRLFALLIDWPHFGFSAQSTK